MDITLIWSFMVASVLLTLSPGPDILLVITESVTNGVSRGLKFALGLCTGIFVHIAIASTGVGFILQKSELAMQMISIFGALYLLYLAWNAWKEEVIVPNFEDKSQPSSTNMYRMGFIMNVLNPKVTLFFLALLPQFVDSEGWHITIQMSILGLLFLLQAIVIMCGAAIVSSQLRRYLKNPKFYRGANYFKIGVLILISGFLFYHAFA